MNKNYLIGFLSIIVLGLLVFVLRPQKEQNIKTGVTNENIENIEKQPGTSVRKSAVLDLSNKDLDELPNSALGNTSIEELDISNNNITGALPSEIGKLKDLKILNASNNQMTGVPAEVGQLANLEVLDLSNNQLTGLPNELANLKRLKVLNLSGNSYSKQDLEVIKKGLPEDAEIIL